MSHNDPLPAELTYLETQLRKLSLPTSKLSKEETLYQCGWAAAEAHFRGTHLRKGLIWKASTGVLAASVLVLGVLLVRQDVAHQSDSPSSGDGRYARQGAVVELASDSRPVAEAKPLPVSDFAIRFAPDDRSLLAVRERALRGILPESSKTANQAEAQYRQPKTHRELLDEFIEGRIHS